MRCLTGARFSMEAELLRQVNTTSREPNVIDSSDGVWVESQNPITGEIHNEWKPVVITPDNPSTDFDETTVVTIPCMVRGIVSGGVRMGGTTEVFGDVYDNIDIVKMWVPAWVNIHKRDQITNIRETKGGKILWKDEEYGDGTRATVFNVNGVIPILDGFNRHSENFLALEKAE